MLTAEQLKEKAITESRCHGTLTEECIYSHEAEAARSAVKKMHRTRLAPSFNNKMQVTPLVSIKLLTSSRTLAAIRTQLNSLVDQTWRTDHVQIKSYEAPGKQYAQIRIFGQSREPIAKAKSAVEKLLAGQIAADGNGPITKPAYFRHSLKSFLNNLGAANGVFIHQDLRRSVLRLHGDDTGIKQVEHALVAKRAELQERSNTSITDLEALAFALKRGNPKRIIVEVFTKDVVQIQEILTSSASSTLETQIFGLSISGEDSELLYQVCVTPPEDPIKTPCGHF
ncbi:hypothetical protein J3E71DRAFT_360872 [Bipolaris maydis]|nr:hypothetical protein J3E73DRAFT_389956 [Bipolaris maydis]KAJ6283341.1 hypothetical protein J3E71DRAFT_360872 [Bipolaris maydis]